MDAHSTVHQNTCLVHSERKQAHGRCQPVKTTTLSAVSYHVVMNAVLINTEQDHPKLRLYKGLHVDSSN